MAGHSTWSKVKHIKGPLDAKRGTAFSKLVKEITVAAHLGGGDPAGNLRLRSVIETARAANMPKDNVERAIKTMEASDEYDDTRNVYADFEISEDVSDRLAA